VDFHLNGWVLTLMAGSGWVWLGPAGSWLGPAGSGWVLAGSGWVTVIVVTVLKGLRYIHGVVSTHSVTVEGLYIFLKRNIVHVSCNPKKIGSKLGPFRPKFGPKLDFWLLSTLDDLSDIAISDSEQ